MKKQMFFLLVLPAVVILAGCSHKDKDKNALFQDDAVVLEGESREGLGAFPAQKKKGVPIYVAELSDVSGGTASGIVESTFENGTYQLRAEFENLPKLEGTDFYEGWVVRKGDNLSVVSTGRLTKEGGKYINVFTSPRDLRDHTEYVLTVEPDDGDPAPAAHVLQGGFVLDKGKGDDSHDHDHDHAAAVMPAEAFTITGKNFAFSQEEIRVKKGTKVTVDFFSTQGFHDFVIDEFDVATDRVNPGKTTAVTFVADKAGTFEYYCSVGNHRAQGMVGKLIVE